MNSLVFVLVGLLLSLAHALVRQQAQCFPRCKASREAAASGPEQVEALMEHVENILLPKMFGHTRFRSGQREIVRNVLAGRSCLAILPTGAGKSLLYMLPSQLLDGITVVVSPLLALMRDQVEALRSQGITAIRIDSSLTLEEMQSSFQQISARQVKVLFISPERFNNEAFRRLLSSMEVALFVVDEAHCISDWGHAFRPDYLRLSTFAAMSNAKVRLALTATATSRVAQDILDKLDISSDDVVRLPSLRENLHLAVRSFAWPHDDYEPRYSATLEAIREVQGACIVYVGRQKLAERLAADLVAAGYTARAYHAGMDTEERASVEDWFLNKQDVLDAHGHVVTTMPIVVGTVAFGMGIDKSNIRSVIHFDLPRSIEEYVQGFGRAGRDGKPAKCLALLADSDYLFLRNQIYGATPTREAFRKAVGKFFSPDQATSVADPSLFMNHYDTANDFDIPELSLRLGMSHLVQQGILTELTPVYGVYKISIADREAFDAHFLDVTSKAKGVEAKRLLAAKKTIQSKAADAKRMSIGGVVEATGEAEWLMMMEEEARMGDFAGGGGEAPTQRVALNAFLAQRIIETILEESEAHPRRKTFSMNVLELANNNSVTPLEVLASLNSLTREGGCAEEGLSRVYSRYKLLDNAHVVGNGLDNITEILFKHALEIQRRGLAREDEIFSLLRGCSGTETSDEIWQQIGLYFDEGSRIGKRKSRRMEDGQEVEEGHKQAPSFFPDRSFTVLEPVRDLIPFDQQGWKQVVEAVESDVIPYNDALLIARFATGVSSPRIIKLRLSRLETFGICSFCEWSEVLRRATELRNVAFANRKGIKPSVAPPSSSSSSKSKTPTKGKPKPKPKTKINGN